MAPREILALAKDTLKEFSKDEATWKAAALSYFTVFALAPLLVILLQIASFIWDPAQVRDALTGQFQALMGQEVARQVQTMMMSAEQKTAAGSGVRLILSIAGLLFGATGAFVSLQEALNRAWEVEPDPKRGGVRNFIMKRVLSLGMLLAIAFLLLVSLAVTAALSAAGDLIFGALGETFAHILNFVLTLAVISLLFGAMFRYLPDAKVEWRDVWVGAIATALFFVVGKFLIGLYIGQSNPGSAFGAAGALAVLLVWIYYAALILILGAEFTQVWMTHHGRVIEPQEGAVRVVEKKERIRGSSVEEERRSTDTPERAPAAAAVRSSTHDNVDQSTEREHKHKRSERVVETEREIAATRGRMSDTVTAIESRLSDASADFKDKLDAPGFVKTHPWPLLAAAVVAGVALSSTLSDGNSSAGGDDAGSDHEGILQRAKEGVIHVVETQGRRLEHELRRAADDITRIARG
jgi:membrane protein